MAEQWIMVRLPRMLADGLREVAESREQARQLGHPAHQERSDVEPLHKVIEALLEQYHAHSRRRSRSKRNIRHATRVAAAVSNVYTEGVPSDA